MRFSLNFRMVGVCLIMIAAYFVCPAVSHSQVPQDDAPIMVEGNAVADEKIEQRIEGLFQELGAFDGISVSVSQGVVTLSGEASNDAQALQARNLAARLEGVVAVEDEVVRTLDLEGNLNPLWQNFLHDLSNLYRALPLLGIALLVFGVVAWLTNRLAGWMSLWRRITPNPFLADLASQAARIVGIMIALMIALNLLGASALMGTILGGAGVVGIAVGFAVRDSLENYISSIMLSIRQPFRGGDYVVIDGTHEGVVIRLTSRATILMNASGNHLRVPNSTVFKSVILNYTTNPERRFHFELGVDSADDPIAAMSKGVEAIAALPFVLDDPKPKSSITTVGDSNIVIKFQAWVNQTESDFAKSRSLAIRAAMRVLETEGFTLPEPIYRLKIDAAQAQASGVPSDVAIEEHKHSKNEAPDLVDMDVAPDTHLEDKAAEERAETGENDLLDEARPVE